MPTYEYKCDNGHTFDAMQSMSEDALDSCVVCGAPARRVLHAPAVHFKGSGFYTTDYARKKGATATTANGSEPAKSEAGSDSKGSDSKSDYGSSSGSGDKAAAKQD